MTPMKLISSEESRNHCLAWRDERSVCEQLVAKGLLALAWQKRLSRWKDATLK